MKVLRGCLHDFRVRYLADPLLSQDMEIETLCSKKVVLFWMSVSIWQLWERFLLQATFLLNRSRRAEGIIFRKWKFGSFHDPNFPSVFREETQDREEKEGGWGREKGKKRERGEGEGGRDGEK